MRQDGLGVVIKEEQACLESVTVQACTMLPIQFASVCLGPLFFFPKSHFRIQLVITTTLFQVLLTLYVQGFKEPVIQHPFSFKISPAPAPHTVSTALAQIAVSA